MPFSITLNYNTPPASPPTTPPPSDEEIDDLTDPVFMNLVDEFIRRCREKGVFCAKDWECCQTCGHAAMDELGHQNYLFYHEQDGERLRNGELECYFSFAFESVNIRNDVEEIVNELGGHWNGSDTTRIRIHMTPMYLPPILHG